MRNKISEYHLHKNDYSKLHFELNDISTHLKRNYSHVYKAHRHSFYMFIWFKNEGKHFIDYEEIHHPANSIFLIKKNQIHYFKKDSSNEGISFHFDEFFLNKAPYDDRNRITFNLFNETGLSYIRLDKDSIEIFQRISMQIRSEIKVKDHNHRNLIFSYMQILILVIERLKFKLSDKALINDINLELAINFNTLVEKNMKTFLTVEDYSNKISISQTKLYSISLKYFLMSPSKYIAFKKILEAKRLLSNVNIPIKQVAYELGFEQPTYFTKYFKKNTGLTPKEFKNKIPV